MSPQPKLTLAEIGVVLDVVRDAVRERKPLWLAAQDKIQGNRHRLRVHRALARRVNKPELRAHLERVCRRYLAENRRVHTLAKRFTSWQRPGATP